jgi:hypothetical protein
MRSWNFLNPIELRDRLSRLRFPRFSAIEL